MSQHPTLNEYLANDRIAELRRSRQDAGLNGRRRRAGDRLGPRGPRRHLLAALRAGTGWLLIEAGLRLTVARGSIDRRSTLTSD
ncbi:MAG: hypothetical protein ACRDL5_16665 [Solirubrobacteraceae bacterium]